MYVRMFVCKEKWLFDWYINPSLKKPPALWYGKPSFSAFKLPSSLYSFKIDCIY